MLNNWLSPVSREKFGNFKNYTRLQFGKKLLFHKDSYSSLENIHIAIVGVEEEESDAVRKVLYPLNYPFRGLRIADLGNIRKKDPSFLIPVIKELLDAGIVPIIIGSSNKLTIPQFQAYHLKKEINLAIIDEKIRLNTTKEQLDKSFFLKKLFTKRKPKLFNLGLIGFQSHFTPKRVIDQLLNKNFELTRLGQVRKNIEEVEPIIRDAHLLSFNIAALKAAEAPGQISPSPSGFTSEEACQISRYAGLSDKLTSIGFYGFVMENDSLNQTAQVMSQLIWYFVDGFHSRKNDFPASTEGLIEYIVEYKTLDHQVRFWKSKKSGRWWMEIPQKIKRKKTKHHMIACSYHDYQLACQEKLPERLMTAYRRFE